MALRINDQSIPPCNMCGKSHSSYRNFKHTFGYGTKYDMTVVRFSLCDSCIESVYNLIKEQCVIAPEEQELF